MGGLAAMALVVGAVPAMAESVEFQLINNSSYALHYFYTSPSNDTNWGGDLLGDDGTLEAGYSGTVTIGDGETECEYDFKFVMDTGAELVVPGINICELNSYTLND
ncbi:MAG: hypothetical protein JWR51_3881 [Devosia sp.]|nr:hypothetical protein [Devosia sp.]